MNNRKASRYFSWSSIDSGGDTRSILSMFILFLSVALSGSVISPSIDAKLIKSPPKLEQESEREVWFQVKSSGATNKFTLKCHASGDPENYYWYKNGETFRVDEERVIWQRPGQSGTIIFLRPQASDQGYYQCHAKNIFGTAVSNIFRAKLGVLDHFAKKPVREVEIQEGESLTLNCDKPYGVPAPTVFWLFRNTKQTYVIETIKREHITVDGDGNLQFAHVTMHDGRENLIYQCAATSPVLHGEYRSGDEIRLNVTPGRTLFKPVDKLWWSPEQIQIIAGQKLKLSCIFSGYPAVPKVDWMKEDGEIRMDRLEWEDYGKTLVIDPVHPSDSGTYTCQVKGAGVKHSMTVLVTAAPYWEKASPSDVSVPEDKSTELRCEASGDPMPLVRWYMNGQPFSDIAENERRTLLSGGRVLKIESLNHDVDTGVYQCNASNPLGYVFANAFVNVLAHAPRFMTPLEMTLKVVKGTNLDLNCTVDAAPLPVVKWVDERNKKIKPRPGKVQIFQNHTLRLLDLSLLNSGLYYCNVTNRYGINRIKRVLEVYEHTFMRVPLKQKSMTVEAGASMDLYCEAEPDERLSVQYKWVKDKEYIDFEMDDHAYQKVTENRIKLFDLRGKHSGTYKCVAKTPVDTKKSVMRLLVKDVPEAPEIIDISCNERHASIKWKAAHDNAVPVKQYIVEYSTAFHPDRWHVALTEENVDNDKFEAVMSLSPWVNYTFRVLAVNKRGRSPPGYKFNRCNTAPSYPYINPMNVSGKGDAKDNLVIFWQPMEKEDWNADNFRYLIKYRLDEPGSEWKEFEVEDPKLGKTTIRDTPTFRKYLIQVRAINSVGPSIVEPENVIGYSGEDVPSAAPENFKATELINSSSVRFVWNHVDPQSVNGHFQSYILRSWELFEKRFSSNVDGMEPLRDVVIPAEENSAVVSIYEPTRTYKVQIVAKNSDYEGPLSRPVRITMPEGLPSEVEKLSVIPMGANTIMIDWKKPREIRGILKGYYLNITDLNATNTNETIFLTYVLNRQRHYIHETAIPKTTYEVSVWGETGGGQGPKVTRIVSTFPLEEPAEPIVEVEVKSSTEARIKWLLRDGAISGSGFYLNYSSRGSNNWFQSKLIELPLRQFTLDNLMPGKFYELYLVATEKNRSTQSEKQIFKTEGVKIGGTSITTDNLTSAAWFIAVICAVAVAVIAILACCIHQRSKGGKYPVKKKELERGTPNLDNEEERSFMEYQYGAEYKEDS